MTVRFVNKDTARSRADGLHGRLPDDDRFGTSYQRTSGHRHAARPFAGAYLMEPKDPTKQVFTRTSCRAAVVARARDRQEGHRLRPASAGSAAAITTLLRALPAEDPTTGFQLDKSTNEAILALFDNSIVHRQHARQGSLTREEEPHQVFRSSVR